MPAHKVNQQVRSPTPAAAPIFREEKIHGPEQGVFLIHLAWDGAAGAGEGTTGAVRVWPTVVPGAVLAE